MFRRLRLGLRLWRFRRARRRAVSSIAKELYDIKVRIDKMRRTVSAVEQKLSALEENRNELHSRLKKETARYEEEIDGLRSRLQIQEELIVPELVLAHKKQLERHKAEVEIYQMRKVNAKQIDHSFP